MDKQTADAPELDSSQNPDALTPTPDADVATVSVVDGMWQDQPDNVAAFVEARLGDLARGRGNLYICLDVSGEVEGRSEIERALIEVIRDTYATGRGSISFGLSEALRAANAFLYESNRQVARELRRMAGVSAVVLRGTDLYIAQSGPAVVYVEASEKLARYPAESDWFVEDAPLIAPQGTASAPLGIRREFASDLAHASVAAGDVFVLATRSLTTLALTEELAIAFTERSAQEIASHLEEFGEDADLTALVAELTDPHAAAVTDYDDAHEFADAPEQPHVESLPVPLTALVALDESEPPLESGQEDEFAEESEWERLPAAPQAATETDLDWDADEEDAIDREGESLAEPNEPEAVQDEPAAQPVYSAAAALPLMHAPAFAPPPVPNYAAELEQRRAERDARRAAQQASAARAFGGILSAVMLMFATLGGLFAQLFGAVNWDGIGKRVNRALNLGVSALIALSLFIVRLILPGTAAGSVKILPRRATSDPAWLKAFAIALPVLFIALALGRFMLEVGNKSSKFDALVAQADTIVKQAEVNPDKEQAREQLNDALKVIGEARALRDAQNARVVLYRIQNQLNELDGIPVLYFLPTVAQVGGGQLKQIVASDQDVFLLDGRGRIYQFVVNDASGASKPAVGDGTLLKVGDAVGDKRVGALKLLTGAARPQDKTALVAVADNAILLYDLEAGQWTVSPVNDAAEWGDLRAIASFGSNIYLLDAQNGQIYRYTPTATGFSAQGTPYFAREARPVLNKAVDMAIDGDVWVLNDNGSIQRFRAGTAIPFALGALPTPLKNPVAIFTRPEVDSLYIADAGNQRIVEFDKNGRFVRQFKPNAEKGDVFMNMRDLTVNETKRKLYFVNADAAYMANVPK